MGIPLYREKPAVAVSPSVKLPIVCPYVGPQHNQPTTRAHHHHHHQHPQQQPGAVPDALNELSRIASERNAEEVLVAGQNARAWRQMPRLQHSSRERSSGERSSESHERSTSASNRYTQRIVRSQPGTREYDDELRAAELVDLYFQELARIRAASNGQDSTQSDSEGSPSDNARSRTSTERVMDLVARRQRRFDSSGTVQSPAMDRRSMHETLVRQHQRAQRSPRVVIPRDLPRVRDSFGLDQEMQEAELDN